MFSHLNRLIVTLFTIGCNLANHHLKFNLSLSLEVNSRTLPLDAAAAFGLYWLCQGFLFRNVLSILKI